MSKYLNGPSFQLVSNIVIAELLILDVLISPQMSLVTPCSSRSAVPNVVKFGCFRFLGSGLCLYLVSHSGHYNNPYFMSVDCQTVL